MSKKDDIDELNKMALRLIKLSRQYKNRKELSATLHSAGGSVLNCAIDIAYRKEVGECTN